MKRILHFITKNFLQNQSLPLGRWNIENCNKKINHKIDLSNEDHCGPCGQYIMDKKYKHELHEKTYLPKQIQ
jgi:hypothetical protein